MLPLVALLACSQATPSDDVGALDLRARLREALPVVEVRAAYERGMRSGYVARWNAVETGGRSVSVSVFANWPLGDGERPRTGLARVARHEGETGMPIPLIAALALAGATPAMREAALAAETPEPTVREVQKAAAAHAGIDPKLAESWRRRVRRAAWLPKLTAEWMHEERTFHVVGIASGGEVDYVRLLPGDKVGLKASWDLRDLVFDADELRVAAASADLVQRRREIVGEATKLFFARRRLRAELAPPGLAEAERAEKELALAEATALLDAITGGLYSKSGGGR